MSFTKIPNFSNCNVWLPQQQLNIVMKYYYTRVKSTSFLKFSLLFLVKCHLYNKHFFFVQQHKQLYNYAHYCNTRDLFVFFLNQWEGKRDPVAFLLAGSEAPPLRRVRLLIGWPDRLDLEMTNRAERSTAQ